jgi:predicted RNA-binding Zn ribbon-like protein
MQRNEAPGELELVRRFVNTRDIEEESDELESPEFLLSWFAGRDLLDENVATADEKDLELALALREGIRSLLLANSSGEEIETVRIRELNRAARSMCLRVRFDHDGGATLEPQSSGVSAALGRILAVVVQATEEGIWGRLKVCSNDACQWAFYDHSKNRSGKWCTMEVCGNRMKARTFRQRQASRNGVSHPAQQERG